VGLGSDIIRFDTLLNATTNRDTISDFNVTDDTIQLENAIFTSLATLGTLAAGSFRSGAGITSAADANDYLIYNSTTGALYYDADGSGAGVAAVQFAYPRRRAGPEQPRLRGHLIRISRGRPCTVLRSDGARGGAVHGVVCAVEFVLWLLILLFTQRCQPLPTPSDGGA
jgi:hypothetical protein